MHVFGFWVVMAGMQVDGSSCTVGIFLSLFLLNQLTPQLIENGWRNQEEKSGREIRLEKPVSLSWLLKETELPVYLVSHMRALPGLFERSKKNMYNFLLSCH